MSLVLIPLAPFIAFLIIIFWGRRLGRVSAGVSIVAMCLSIGATVDVWRDLLQGIEPSIGHVAVWLGGQGALSLGLRADPLTGIMLSVVTLIATLIHLYSIGYMAGDIRFSRFFAYLSLFCASMLGLVLADNFLLLFVCWELVGLCSYLLISFWFEKPEAAAAGKKAFLTTRVGDVGLLIGIFVLFAHTGTLEFASLPFVAGGLSAGTITLVTLGILAGAAGKSAQFPLHVWLPDAMEGPTAVSALIHAATMVAAGIYLVARTFPLFAVAETTLAVAAIMGAVTALGAATIACTMHDVKRVLAYSTISQLGFMMAALGVGSTTAAIFHLTTHAWFKALLFLGAGSVIHAVQRQDMMEMGGLRRGMPVTCATMFIGVWAISGLPPLSGFWSKESILMVAWAHHPGIAWILIVTSALTAFYMVRWFSLIFLGTPRGSAHPHESPAIMTVPLMVLSIGAAGVGLLGSPWAHHWFASFLTQGHVEHHDAPAWLAWGTCAAAGCAVVIALKRYTSLKPLLPASIWRMWQPVHTLCMHKYYIDELYGLCLIRPVQWLAHVYMRMDQRVIDRAIDLTAALGVQLSAYKGWFDQHVVDALVNGVGAVATWSGRTSRKIQSGLIENYLIYATLGAVVMMWAVLKEGVR